MTFSHNTCRVADRQTDRKATVSYQWWIEDEYIIAYHTACRLCSTIG